MLNIIDIGGNESKETIQYPSNALNRIVSESMLLINSTVFENAWNYSNELYIDKVLE